jgi:hemagglutinin-like protein
LGGALSLRATFCVSRFIERAISGYQWGLLAPTGAGSFFDPGALGIVLGGQGGPTVTVNQSSNSAIINWNTFNIGRGESVTFQQPNSGSVALNRVTGGLGPSQILGSLTANGRIFLINRWPPQLLTANVQGAMPMR